MHPERHPGVAKVAKTQSEYDLSFGLQPVNSLGINFFPPSLIAQWECLNRITSAVLIGTAKLDNGDDSRCSLGKNLSLNKITLKPVRNYQDAKRVLRVSG